jgi:hypothetical protein
MNLGKAVLQLTGFPLATGQAVSLISGSKDARDHIATKGLDDFSRQ